MSFPEYPPAPKVERKVTAATVAVFVGLSALMYVLELAMSTPFIVSPLPDVLEPPVLAVIPSVIALVAGYLARHTPRPDLPESKR